MLTDKESKATSVIIFIAFLDYKCITESAKYSIMNLFSAIHVNGGPSWSVHICTAFHIISPLFFREKCFIKFRAKNQTGPGMA